MGQHFLIFQKTVLQSVKVNFLQEKKIRTASEISNKG